MLYYKATAGCGLRVGGVFGARTRRPFSVTVLPLTFDGLPIKCMGGVCRDPLTLSAVSCESRSKVMEMEEHPPSWGEPGKLRIVLCERPLSHLGAWLAYGAV